mgnify:FL=1
MPIVVAGVVLWLTRGWWLLGLGAVLGLLWRLGLRGWTIGLVGVLLWLATAAAIWRMETAA